MHTALSGIALLLIAGLATGCGKGATSTATSNTTTTTTTSTTVAGPGPASLTSVPFVGCAQDGQSGPSPAPSGAAKSAMLDPVSASKLAFYSADGTTGVLAPRGWNCFGDYGSDGAMLFVAPIPMASDIVLGENFAIAGPGIELAMHSGDTSGRFEVAKVIARLFPAHMSFTQGVIAEGIEPAGDFVTGAPPTDKLTVKGAAVVEFETPANTQGVGSFFSLMTPDADPIDGAAVLQGATPDAAVLSVRLTPDMRGLTPMIVQQFETDAAQPASGAANAQPAAAPAAPAQPPPQPVASGGGGPLGTVGNFYYALGQGDGATASSLVVPQMRGGNFAPAALSSFYGRMTQPLQLQSSSMSGPNTVFVRYTFVVAGGRACNGAANVYTTQVGAQTLISSIQTLTGC